MKHHTTDPLSLWKTFLFSATAGVAVAAPGLTAFSLPYLRGASPIAQVGGSAFEVVSVTPNKSGDTRGGCCRLESGGQLSATNVTLRELIQSAYQRHAFGRREIEGGPPWVDSERLDVVAKAAGERAIDSDGLPGRPGSCCGRCWRTVSSCGCMSRAGTVRLTPSSWRARTGSSVHGSGDPRSTAPPSRPWYIKGQRPEKPACASASYPGRFVATALTLPSVASILSGSVDRIVIDQAGLTGTFDLELEAVEIQPPGPFGPSFRPSDTKQSIFMAPPQQLGLKLEAMPGTVDVLVIESAEQPTPSNP